MGNHSYKINGLEAQWVSVRGVVTFLRLSVCFVVLNALIAAGLYLPGVPTEPAFMLPLLLAVVCASGGVYLVHDRELGALRLRRLWQGLRLLPSWLQIGLAMLFVATLVHFFARLSSEVFTDLDAAQVYAVNSLWMGGLGTALTYSAVLRKRLGDKLPAEVPMAVNVAVGAIGVLAVVASLWLGMRQNAFDDVKLHSSLQSRFGTASWTPHLVAVNDDHGRFTIYLNIDERAILSDACQDLVPVAAELSRKPQLYLVADGDARYPEDLLNNDIRVSGKGYAA